MIMKKEMISGFGSKEAMKKLKEAIKEYNALSDAGISSEEISKRVEEIAKENKIFDPKKATKLFFMQKNIKNADKDELEQLIKEEKEISTRVVFNEFKEVLLKELGEGKGLVAVETIKENEDFKTSYSARLPYNLKNMADPFGTKSLNIVIPTSVPRIILGKSIAEVTDEIIYFINFYSVCYNQYNNKYELHRWLIKFAVIDGVTVTDDEDDELEL